MKTIYVETSALTRVEYCTWVEVPDDFNASCRAEDIADILHDIVPADEFTEDYDFWSRSDAHWEEFPEWKTGKPEWRLVDGELVKL